MGDTNIVLEQATDRNVAGVLSFKKPGSKPGAASTQLRVSKTSKIPKKVARPSRPILSAAATPAHRPSWAQQQQAAPHQPGPSRLHTTTAPLMRRADLRAAFVDMAAPDKVAGVLEDDDDEDGSDGGGSFDEGGSFESGSGGDGSLGDDASLADGDDVSPEDGGGEGGEASDPLRPSPGYLSLEDEKCDILAKLDRLKKQGRYTSKSFTIFSDIREMRAELARVRTQIDLEASIRFQRKMLMAAVSALEFGNKKFNVADLHLDGWSEQVHSELDTYDDVFGDLFYKYRSKISAPPEIRLLLMVGSSGLMFHLSHSMFKAAMPQIQQAINSNPELVKQMASAYANAATANATDGGGGGGGGGGGDGPRPMRGPGIDVASMLGGGILGGLPGLAGMAPLPRMSRDTDKARPNQAFARQEEELDRLSDVASEDLDSVPSSGLSSPRSTDSRKRKGLGAKFSAEIQRLEAAGVKISKGEGGKKVVVLK